MTFNKENYIQEQAERFFSYMLSTKNGIPSFRNNLKYYLNNLNNQADRNMFISTIKDLIRKKLTEVEQESIKHFIYVIEGF